MRLAARVHQLSPVAKVPTLRGPNRRMPDAHRVPFLASFALNLPALSIGPI
jgi:hypothetical protein